MKYGKAVENVRKKRDKVREIYFVLKLNPPRAIRDRTRTRIRAVI